jgi:hypothetical protein
MKRKAVKHRPKRKVIKHRVKVRKVAVKRRVKTRKHVVKRHIKIRKVVKRRVKIVRKPKMDNFSALRKKDKILRHAASLLNTEPEALPMVIAKFKREISEAKSEIKRLCSSR